MTAVFASSYEMTLKLQALFFFVENDKNCKMNAIFLISSQLSIKQTAE